MSENLGVGGKEDQRRRQNHRRAQANRVPAKPQVRPNRFQRSDRRGCSRRALVTAVLLVLVVALIIPVAVSLNIVGRSVPPITQRPGARLVPDESAVPNTRVLTRPPQ